MSPSLQCCPFLPFTFLLSPFAILSLHQFLSHDIDLSSSLCPFSSIPFLTHLSSFSSFSPLQCTAVLLSPCALAADENSLAFLLPFLLLPPVLSNLPPPPPPSTPCYFLLLHLLPPLGHQTSSPPLPATCYSSPQLSSSSDL